MASFKNITQYQYKDPAVAALIFNAQDEIFKQMFATVSNFMDSINTLFSDQLTQTKMVIVIMSCLFGILIVVQAPTSYALNNIVHSQIDIFLKLPNRVCAKLERSANDFINKVRVCLHRHVTIYHRTARTLWKKRPLPPWNSSPTMIPTSRGLSLLTTWEANSSTYLSGHGSPSSGASSWPSAPPLASCQRCTSPRSISTRSYMTRSP